ncbi:MAG: hypothetical protein WCT07_03325 [Candidatus Paceibacterota bacterium]
MLKNTMYEIFSPDGKLSSSRIGFFIALIAVIIFTGYDTWINKRLDIGLAGLILTAGTTGYGIHKTTEKGEKTEITPSGGGQ